MKKVLKVQITMNGGKSAELKIIEQSHLGDKFGNERGFYKKDSSFVLHTFYHKGIVLGSYNFPAWHEMFKQLYVRGNRNDKDDRILKIETKYIPAILEAVKAYNECEFPEPVKERKKLPEEFVKDLNKLLNEYDIGLINYTKR